MYSDDDESEDDEDSGSGKDSKNSRKMSKDLGKSSASPTKLGGATGGLRLGVSVGAKTIETAEKFIKKD